MPAKAMLASSAKPLPAYEAERKSYRREPATFFPVYTMNCAKATMPIGTTYRLIRPGGVLEHFLDTLESDGMGATLELRATDVAHIDAENPSLLARLQRSGSLAVLSATFTNMEPFIAPELLRHQITYGERAMRGFANRSEVGLLPGHAINQFSAIHDAPQLLEEHGWRYVLFEKSQDPKYQPQGITKTPFAVFRHPAGHIRGVVASKQLSGLYHDYFRGGENAADLVDHIIGTAVARKNVIVAGRFPLEAIAQREDGIERFEALTDELKLAAAAHKLRMRRFDQEAIHELDGYFSRPLSTFDLSAVDQAAAEKGDFWAHDMHNLLLGGGPRTRVVAMLLAEHEYRAAVASLEQEGDICSTAERVGRKEIALLVREAYTLAANARTGEPLTAGTATWQPHSQRRMRLLETLVEQFSVYFFQSRR